VFVSGLVFSNAPQKMVKSIRRCGCPLDSSVSKGYKAQNDLRVIDYTHADSKYRPGVNKYDICKNERWANI